MLTGHRQVTLSALLIFGIGAASSACRTPSAGSGVKDAAFSSLAQGKVTPVLWLANDNTVHKGICPAQSPVNNHTCPGIVEKTAAMPFADYKTSLRNVILRSRPGGGPSGNTSSGTNDAVVVKSLQDKIKRLEDKLATGQLTDKEQASFKNQIEDLNSQLGKLLPDLTAAEQKEFDEIVSSLSAGNDVTYDEGERRFQLASRAFHVKGGLLPPLAGETDQPLEVAAVVDYMNRNADRFYGKQDGYSSGTPVSIVNEPISSCLGACPPYYSDLVCHFYCWHPSYKDVVPNIRGCFTQIARGAFPVKKNGAQLNSYADMFDYCMYQDFEPIAIKNGQKKLPAYDQAIIDANKATDNKIGVLKYMSPEDAEVFQYVMNGFYNPFTFSVQDQQQVLDQFYATHPNVTSKPNVSNNGKAKHPQYDDIEKKMKIWDAENQ